MRSERERAKLPLLPLDLVSASSLGLYLRPHQICPSVSLEMTSRSRNNRVKLVLFDIDGTLIMTHGAGRRAITRALLDEMGVVGPPDGFRFDGKTDPQIVMELLAAADSDKAFGLESVENVCKRYVELLALELQSATVHVEVLPGVKELIELLVSSEAVVLGLLTGNLERGASLKLISAGIDPHQFVVGAFGSDSRARSDLPRLAAQRASSLMGHEPSGHDVVIIGDTPADITCGREIGARAIAVTTGSYTRDELEEAGPFAVFDDLSDTPRVLEAVLA